MTEIPNEPLTDEVAEQATAAPTTEFPPEPTSIQETGLSRSLLTRLVVKALYVMGELTEASIGQQLKLPYSIVKDILTSLCKEKYVEIKGPGDSVGIVFRYWLTDLGLARAQEYMDTSHYVGPAPVTLPQFQAMVHRQSAMKWPFTRPMLEEALRDLVLTRQVCDQLGGAVNSGTPVFLYGESGNGKTVIAEAIGKMLSDEGGGETGAETRLDSRPDLLMDVPDSGYAGHPGR